MAQSVEYVRTADGDEAARIAHLVIALVPMNDGSSRTMVAWPARDPALCTRRDFNPGGFKSTDVTGFRAEVEDYARHHDDLALLERRPLDQAVTRALHNPWGTADNAVSYGDGVIRVDCPGHGGFLVTEAANARIAEPWRNDVGIDGHAFYEEDCESSIVRYSIPELFTDWERAEDERNLRCFMPDQWEAVTGVTLLPGQSLTRDREVFLAANASNWIVSSAERCKSKPGMVIVTSYKGGRDARGRTRGAERRHVLESSTYDTRRKASGVLECVILETDREIARSGSSVDMEIAA